jgi:hypothetical protein
MAVTSIPAAGQAPNWRCARCELAFYDPTNARPCPRCKADDALEETTPPPAMPKSAPVQGAAVSTAKVGALVGIFALVFGGIPWLEGARTTRDGWVVLINWVLARLHLPFIVPLASAWPWWVAISVLIALGWGYSRVEIKHAPFRAPRDRKDFFNRTKWHINPSWQVWLIWLLIIISDVGTMYLGARQASDSDPVFLQQVAASARVAATYAIIITFVPDRLVRWGWRRLRG